MVLLKKIEAKSVSPQILVRIRRGLNLVECVSSERHLGNRQTEWRQRLHFTGPVNSDPPAPFLQKLMNVWAHLLSHVNPVV